MPPLFCRLRVNDFGRRLILPGFVDLHLHASQFYQAGVGLAQNLIPWLYSPAVHLEERELVLIENNAVRLVHSPGSQYQFGQRNYAGLGAVNIEGSIWDWEVISAQAIIWRSTGNGVGVSNFEAQKFYAPQTNPLATAEVFYMGTKDGGSFFGRVESFEQGYPLM